MLLRPAVRMAELTVYFLLLNWITFLDLHYLYFSDSGQRYPIQYMFYGYDPVRCLKKLEESDGSPSLPVLRPVVGLHEGDLYAYGICTRSVRSPWSRDGATRRSTTNKPPAVSCIFHNKAPGSSPTRRGESPPRAHGLDVMAVPCQCS